VTAIWKFPVPIPRPNGRAYIDLPDGAYIRSTGIQTDDLVVWATIPDEKAATHCHRSDGKVGFVLVVRDSDRDTLIEIRCSPKGRSWDVRVKDALGRMPLVWGKP